MSEFSPTPQLDRDLARLLLVMRRMIRDEFGERIAVAEDGALPRMVDFAARSSDISLREMGVELASALTPVTHADAAAEQRVVYYRGAARAVADTTKPAAAATQYLYRGRPVRA